MSRQSEANSRERTLGENIVIISLVAILMGAFIHYFFKQEQQFTQAGFGAVAKKFSAKVTAIRAQWFMDNQPDIVIIKEANVEEEHISVNQKGWVDFAGELQNCRKVWQAIINADLSFMNQPVAVVEVKNEQNPLKNVCRYSLASGEYFDYHLESGNVTEIKLFK